MRRVLVISATMAAAGALMLWRLGSVPVTSPHEARVLGTAEAAVRSGDWLLPRFNFEPRLVKPPLAYWVTAAAGAAGGAFGPGGFRHVSGSPGEPSGYLGVVRLPAVVAGLVAVAAVLALAVRGWGLAWGCLAALVLATTLVFLTEARLNRVDIHLVAWTTVALAVWYARYSEPALSRPRLWQAASWVALGLAFLAKGPAVFLTVVVPMAAWRMLGPARRQREEGVGDPAIKVPDPFFPARAWPAWVGPALFLAVVAPWPIFVGLAHPEAVRVWWHELATRSNPEVHRLRPAYYYATRLPVVLFPWVALTVCGAASVFVGRKPADSGRRERGKRGRGPYRQGPRPLFPEAPADAEEANGGVRRGLSPRLLDAARARPLETYALLWLVGALVCWSFVGQKKAQYVAPAVPGGALLVVAACRRWHQQPGAVAARIGAAAHALVHLGVGGAAVWTATRRPQWLAWALVIGVVQAGAAALVLRGALWRRVPLALAASVVGHFLAALVVFGVLAPDEYRRQDPLALARRARQALAANPGLRLYLVAEPSDAFVFAVDAPAAVDCLYLRFDGPRDAWEPVRQAAESPALLVVSNEVWAAAPDDLTRAFREVGPPQANFNAKGFEAVGFDRPGTPALLLTNLPPTTAPASAPAAASR